VNAVIGTLEPLGSSIEVRTELRAILTMMQANDTL